MAQANTASTNEASVTQTVTVEEETSHNPTLQLKLRKPKSDLKVKWTTETVDNENMNKKKSKCCCVYEKPKVFGESSSSSEDDDETNSCHGHKKKCYRHHGGHQHNHDGEGRRGSDPVDGQGPSSSS
ncbi:uncharacterized protein LOC143289874 [Babylonia areolata]|uniref:uncharacterized protein LOC143289874 n=1 Tax=Babylonia areolata TaxID=304850 RepID=UPI003FD4ED18